MFSKDLVFVCKHLLPDKDQPDIVHLRCKAFPDGKGIPEDYPCQNISDWAVNDGIKEPPKSCPNGCKFEYCDGYEDARVRAERLRKEGYDVPE